MKRIYSFLLASFAVLTLGGCDKNQDALKPNPAPSKRGVTIKEVVLQDNVMTYTPPKGQESNYIISYENNILKLKYDKQDNVRSLRADEQGLYGRNEDKDFIPSDPKGGDIIGIKPNPFFPNGFVAKIDHAEYGVGYVDLHTSSTQLNDVAKDIDYEETINVVDLFFKKSIIETDITSEIKLDEDEIDDNKKKEKEKKGEEKKSVKSLGGKVSAKINEGKIELSATFDYIRRKDFKPGDGKLQMGAGIHLTLDPNLHFRIKKRATSDLPDLFEVSAFGSIDIEVDAKVEAELKRKQGTDPIFLASIPLPPIGLGVLNLVSHLTVDLIFNYEGKIEAQLKILKCHYPYEYTAGYDKNRSKRWYIKGNEHLRSSVDWFDAWSVEASCKVGVDIRSSLNVTINGWKDMRVSGGIGLGEENEIKASIGTEGGGKKDPTLSIKATYEPYIYAELVFKPGVDWFEFSLDRKYKLLDKPKVLFERNFVTGWSIKIEPKDAREVTDKSAILGGDISLNQKNKPELIEFGLCLAEHPSPKIEDRVLKYDIPQSTLNYDIEVSNLRSNTKYYYRSYAKYKQGDVTKLYYSTKIKSFTTKADTNTISEGRVLQDIILRDDFKGERLDLQKWHATNSSIRVDNGILKMEQVARDVSTELRTKDKFKAKDWVRLSRKVYIHHANSRSYPFISIEFPNIKKRIVIHYAKYEYAHEPLYGIICTHGEMNTARGSIIKPFYISKNLGSNISDTWFDEDIYISFLEKKLVYTRNNEIMAEVSLPDLQNDVFYVKFDPYGWFIGHKHYMDDFKLEVR